MKHLFIIKTIVFTLMTSTAFGRIYVGLEKAGQVTKPWQTCYTGTAQQAKADLKLKNFSGGNDSSIKNILVSGQQISFDLFVFGESYGKILLNPCPFNEEDNSATVSCEITLQDRGRNTVEAMPVSQLTGSYLPAIALEWQKNGFQNEILDCKNKRALVIRNSWHQELSLANVKIMTEIVNRYHKPLVASAVGSVTNIPGLFPYQKWSGVVQLNFMENIDSAEVYDASIEQFSVPAELENWIKNLNGSWAPWGLHMVSFKCEGFNEVIDPTALEWVMLDVESPEVKAYCSSH